MYCLWRDVKFSLAEKGALQNHYPVGHEQQAMKEKIKENAEKIKVNKTLPYLVSNVIEILDADPQVYVSLYSWQNQSIVQSLLWVAI